MSEVWDSFIIYTTSTGGEYKVIRATREQFDEVVSTRRLVVGFERFSPSYVAYVETVDDYDFVLLRKREANEWSA